MSPFIRVLLLVASLVIVVIVRPSEAAATAAKQDSYDESNERAVKLLEGTLVKLQNLYVYIGRIIGTLTSSLNADGKYKKTATDQKVESQLASLATLHKSFNKVMDKVTAKVQALLDDLTGGQSSAGDGANRVRRFVQSLHDYMQSAI